MVDPDVFPNFPQFSEQDFDECRETGDYSPILFEYYKHVGIVTNLLACIEISSPAARQVPNTHFGVLIGLLNRCSRLMLANVALSHKGYYGETTALVDRCIFESTVLILWLCKQDNEDMFRRYMADGLKTELELKREIDSRIAARGGPTLPIEERMLRSIDSYLRTSKMTESEISEEKRLPDLASMLDYLGRDRLAYVVGQKIGSHYIHGTWPSLLMHYLEWEEDDHFHPRDHNVPTHENQFIFIPLMVLNATIAFVRWLTDEQENSGLIDMLQDIGDEIYAINTELSGDDFVYKEET